MSPTYTSWCAIKARCLNPNSSKYYMYGGKGITICERWMKFENFLEDMGERPNGTSIDRIDGTKGYSPDNCRWSTPKQQSANIKSNVLATYLGVTKTIAEWSEQLGISHCVLGYRIKRGWGDKAFTVPVKYGNRVVLR